MTGRITSPCVGVCSTTVGDSVCRGCQRTDDEILDWFGMTPGQREARIEQLDALREDVASRFLAVVNAELLYEQLRRHHIRFRSGQPPLSCAVELLRVGRRQIRELSRYGLVAHQVGSLESLHERLSAALVEAGEARRGAAASVSKRTSQGID